MYCERTEIFMEKIIFTIMVTLKLKSVTMHILTFKLTFAICIRVLPEYEAVASIVYYRLLLPVS